MNTLLLGIGNTLLGDEGVGVHVVEAVRRRFDLEPAVSVIDGGTMGLDLLPLFQDHERVLLVDAVDFGLEPGHVAVLDGSELPDKILHKFSVHHIGLNDVLGVARLTGRLPRELKLIGIQPAGMEACLELSGVVREKFEELISLAVNQLRDWGITVTPRSEERQPAVTGPATAC